jgi:hypothetical protein
MKLAIALNVPCRCAERRGGVSGSDGSAASGIGFLLTLEVAFGF